LLWLTGGTAVSPALALGVVDQTWECRFKANAADGSIHDIVSNGSDGIRIDAAGNACVVAAGNAISNSINVCDGQWHSICIMLRQNSGGYNSGLFADGGNSNFTSTQSTVSNPVITISAAFGQIDEVRISNTGRIAGTSYPVAVSPFVFDQNTVALWHLDGNGTSG
jgi:hypothetical protein